MRELLEMDIAREEALIADAQEIARRHPSECR
jgi:hypothetical protein